MGAVVAGFVVVGAVVAGTVVAADVGAFVTPQAEPFTLQLVGRPVPLTIMPNSAEAPAAIVAFHPAGVNV